MKKKLLCILLTMVLLLPSVPAIAEETCNHNWEDWQYVEANCGDDGYRYRYCNICWERQEEVTEKATEEHDWTNWVTYEAPTCADEGEKYRECTKCSKDEYASIPATGIHSMSDWIIEEEADCGYDGYMYRECSVCGGNREEKNYSSHWKSSMG
jgi:hypothetical protein